jgi:hypothetical protein
LAKKLKLSIERWQEGETFLLSFGAEYGTIANAKPSKDFVFGKEGNH